MTKKALKCSENIANKYGMLLITLMCFAVGHAQKFSIKEATGCTYEFKVTSKADHEVALVAASNKKTAKLEIPSSVTYKTETFTVTKVLSESLRGCDENLRVLTFPNTVREIDSYLFGSAIKLMGGLGGLMIGSVFKDRPMSLITLESLRIPKDAKDVAPFAFITSVSSNGNKGIKAHIDELPSYITPMVAENYGLNITDVTEYWQANDPNKLNTAENLEAGLRQAEAIAQNMSPAQRSRVLKMLEGNSPYASMILEPYAKMGLTREEVITLMREGKLSGEAAATAATTTPSPAATQTTVAQTPAIQTVQSALANTVPAINPTMTSDVDVNLPESKTQNENTFVVIFANENYQEEVDVQFALNDGAMFRNYCNKVLGIPEENIHIRQNATLNNMLAELDWLSIVAMAFNGEASLIVYYAGHGIPDEATGNAYLLPVDGIGRNLRTGYSLSEFYKQLGEMPAKSITVFMDACFSGAQRGAGMLASARGVAIKAKTQLPISNNMVVLSAAQGDETAYPYKEKAHGLFTYFLLKKLQESCGNCTMYELCDYVKTQVSRRSIITNQKSQTPTVSHTAANGEKWKTMKLR